MQNADGYCPPQYVFIPVQYSVQFPSAQCPPANGTNPPSSSPITVAVTAGSTALDVMQGAVDIDRRFQFQATSFGATLGFLINAIGGTASSSTCFWAFFVQYTGSPATLSNVGVSSFSICHEMSIIFKFNPLSDESEK